MARILVIGRADVIQALIGLLAESHRSDTYYPIEIQPDPLPARPQLVFQDEMIPVAKGNPRKSRKVRFKDRHAFQRHQIPRRPVRRKR